MVSRDFDEHDLDSIRVADPHFVQAPGLALRFSQHSHTTTTQVPGSRAHITYLKPDDLIWARTVIGLAGELKKSLSQKENRTAGKLPKDRKAEHVPIELT